jgi:2-oxoglutarate/2-oxoacid ferredoxin oxidoreductase subunit beta
MVSPDDFKGQEPAWCPGCGNFGIRNAFQRALADLEIEPHRITVVSGIGQSGKFPHYIRCNTFNGLHGRTLPVATGIRLANSGMLVAAFAGDGDCYGEGGNHFLHAVRRNINVKLFVHDNQIYGLTKGQASPTSLEGMRTKVQPFGVLAEKLNPVALAVALDCSLVARGFAGELDRLAELMKECLRHDGFSLLDIFQPCVSFNDLNTFEWYRERCYPLEDDYDPNDRKAAFEKALEFEERIPTGILYRSRKPTYEERFPTLEGGPLVERPLVDEGAVERAINDLY